MENNIATLRDALEYLVNTGRNIGDAFFEPKVLEVKGETYLFYKNGYTRVEPFDKPVQPKTSFFTLTGIVDFILTDVDGIFADSSFRHIVRVISPEYVEVISPAVGYNRERTVVADCKALIPHIPFNSYMQAEDFNIMLQTRFQETEDRDTVLKLAGSLRENQSMKTADDGFSQRVEVKKGVATVSDVIVRNPVPLTPLRTFYEVNQPESPFVVRFREGAECALFEADGGKWKLEAVKNIHGWLVEKLCDANVEVIA